MSISEQVKELRAIANNLSIGHNMPISLAVERFREAADTIEALSAKLADMERSAEDCGGWTPTIQRKPECDGYYEVTVLSVINGESIRTAEQRCYHKDMDFFAPLIEPEFTIDEKVTAWRDMPEPYNEQSAKVCSGGWILCKDKLPEDEGMYLITAKVLNKMEVQYVFFQKNMDLFICNGIAIAWKPLPEPYHEP